MLASMLNVASKGNISFDEVHAVISKILYNEIMPDGDEQLVIYSLQQVGNFAETMETYLEAYMNHVILVNDANY